MKKKNLKYLLIISFLFLYIILIFYKTKDKVDLVIRQSQKYNVINGLIQLYTKWGESLDKNKILQEYPRPQFVRNSYLNLNGEWDYSLINADENPQYDGKIIVPFSIESPLSGVFNKTLLPGMILWYKKIVDLNKIKNKGRFLLHFGAVDQFTEVFINDIKVGEHDGGYTSFYFDITNYTKSDLSKTKIEVKVIDNYSKNGAAFGKQGIPRRHIFYTAIGGIWQTVWIESVPKTYIKDVKITPNYDNHSVSFLMEIDGDEEKNLNGVVKILDSKEKKIINSSNITPNVITNIIIDENFKNWSPEDPYLYKVEYKFGKDIVKAYFGMRKFSIDIDKNNTKRLFLNNKPYFQKGVLDQGYWPDGYYTPPSDEALKFDIITMKELGFNMFRKHIKIETKRWYYHCDTIGMLVWQDQPSGGNYPFNLLDEKTETRDDKYDIYSRSSEEGRKNFIRDIKILIDQLYNFPCISTWVPFNEGWGQFDSLKIAQLIKNLDNTRFVDHASGFVDHGGPDFKSIHNYKRKIKLNSDEKNRPIVLSEYGGIGCAIENHTSSNNLFSYRMHYDSHKLSRKIQKLILNGLIPNINKGLSASVYTQLSDVEGEINGLLTYDRKVLKVDKNLIKRANDLLILKN